MLLAAAPSDLSAQSDCNLPSTVPSLLPNASMEEFYAGEDGCTSQQPSGLPDGTNQANCLVGWQRLSYGTTDAWNAFTLPSGGPGFPSAIPQPLPSGSSAAGFWIGIKDSNRKQYRNGDQSYARLFREYLGACMDGGKGIEAGLDYRLTFHLGFMTPETYHFRGEDIDLASPSGVELSLYGVRTCEQLDFGDYYDCPEDAGAEGYELIANITVEGEAGGWTAATVDFVAAADYEAFAIGGSCGSDITRPDGSFYRNYYFIDDLILNRPEVFEAAASPDSPVAGPVSVSGQSLCADEIVLTGQAVEGAEYQWFHDGTPVAGATDPELTLLPDPTTDGDYTLRITTPVGCATTEPVQIQRPVIQDQFPDSVALCGEGGQITIFPTQQISGTYTWNDGSNKSYYTVTEPGTYSVTISSACIQRVETFEAVAVSDISYRYTMTPERPCVGDTVEIMLESDWYASLVIFTVSDDERHYVAPNVPIKVVAGETDSIGTYLISSCTYYEDTLVVPELTALKAKAAVQDINCQGPTGSITVQTEGGEADQWTWYGPDGQSIDAAGNALSVEVPGSYTVRISGEETCETEVTAEVTDRAFALEVMATDVTCENDGAATALPAGGTPPYAIEWLAAADQPVMARGTAVLQDLPRGSYMTRARDGGGCEAFADFTISGADPLEMEAEVAIAGCSPAYSATLDVTPKGGTAPYTYLVSGLDPVTKSRIELREEGNYGVRVMDANHCVTDTWQTMVTLPEPVSVEILGKERINHGEPAELELSINGFDPADAIVFWDYSSELSFPDGPLRAVTHPEQSATVAVEVVAPDNCVYTDELRVNVFDKVRAYIPNAFSPNGDGTNDRLEVFPNVGVTGIAHFRVFDRWGGLVWERSGESVAWDGTHAGQPARVGTYFYEGSLTTRRGGQLPVRGTVLLTR